MIADGNLDSSEKNEERIRNGKYLKKFFKLFFSFSSLIYLWLFKANNHAINVIIKK